MRWNTAAVAGFALLLASTTATAQPAPDMDPIKARQADFREIGAALKAINDELKKDSPVKYIITSSANRIAAAMVETSARFPKGSGPAPGVKTKARDEIWSNKAEFDRLSAAAVSEAKKLSTMSRGGDMETLRVQAKALGTTCQSCHDKFRARF